MTKADRVRDRYAQGADPAEIAAELGVSRQYVHRVLGPAKDRPAREKPAKIAKAKRELLPRHERFARGGRAKTPAKLAAALTNLVKARAVSAGERGEILKKARAARKKKKDLARND